MQIETDVLIWMTLGIALLSSEAFTGTFHLLFFGLSALATAVIASLGLHNVALQLAVFATCSVLGVLVLRKRLVQTSKGFSPDHDTKLEMKIDLAPGAEGTVTYQGVPWKAVNRSAHTLMKGDTARVLRTEGIKLILEPANPPGDADTTDKEN